MKFLLRGIKGHSLAVGLRLIKDGHDCRLSTEIDTLTGNGLIEKTDFPSGMKWADVVVFDTNNKTTRTEATECKRVGKPHFGAGDIQFKLEHDRQFGMKFAKDAGLTVSEYVSCAGPRAWTKARMFMQSQPTDASWVWKPNGPSGEEPPASTYVTKDRNTMMRMLIYWEAQYKAHKQEPDFILVPKIDGIEISSEVWFNGTDCFAHNCTIEKNRLYDNDLGEKAGCLGNVVYGAETSRLFELLFVPMVAKLREVGYRGPLDVNAIIDEDTSEPTFLEFSPRFGYDAIFAFQPLVPDLGTLFHSIAVGAPWNGRLKEGCFGTIRVHIPPYPETLTGKDKDKAVGVPVFGWKLEPYNEKFCPNDIQMDTRDAPTTSGSVAFVVGDYGSSPQEAMEAAYKQVEKLKIPCMRYRTDLAEKIQEVYDDLAERDWLPRTTAKPLFGERRSNAHGLFSRRF